MVRTMRSGWMTALLWVGAILAVLTLIIAVAVSCPSAAKVRSIVQQTLQDEGIVASGGSGPGPGFTNAIYVNSTLFVDSRYGSPVGTKNDMGSPWSTIDGALAQASSGDVIFVQPGTYIQSVTLVGKNLVNFYLSEGTTVYGSWSLATTTTIDGFGALLSSSGTLFTLGAGANVLIRANSLAVASPAIAVLAASGGAIAFAIDAQQISGGLISVSATAVGTGRVRAGSLADAGLAVIGGAGGPSASFALDLDVERASLSSSASLPLLASSGGIGLSARVNVGSLVSAGEVTAIGFSLGGAGTVTIQVGSLQLNGAAAAVASNAGSATIDIDSVTASSTATAIAFILASPATTVVTVRSFSYAGSGAAAWAIGSVGGATTIQCASFFLSGPATGVAIGGSVGATIIGVTQFSSSGSGQGVFVAAGAGAAGGVAITGGLWTSSLPGGAGWLQLAAPTNVDIESLTVSAANASSLIALSGGGAVVGRVDQLVGGAGPALFAAGSGASAFEFGGASCASGSALFDLRGPGAVALSGQAASSGTAITTLNVAGGAASVTINSIASAVCTQVVFLSGGALDLTFATLAASLPSAGAILASGGALRVSGGSLVATNALGFTNAVINISGSATAFVGIDSVNATGVVGLLASTGRTVLAIKRANVTGILLFPVVVIDMPTTSADYTLGGHWTTAGNAAISFSSASAIGTLRVTPSIFVNSLSGNCIASTASRTVVMEPSIGNTALASSVTTTPSPVYSFASSVT